jgi:hypothetical protein
LGNGNVREGVSMFKVYCGNYHNEIPILLMDANSKLKYFKKNSRSCYILMPERSGNTKACDFKLNGKYLVCHLSLKVEAYGPETGSTHSQYSQPEQCSLGSKQRKMEVWG